jgi:Tol biopolymer transport system component
MAVSPDGQLLAITVGEPPAIYIVDLETGTTITTVTGIADAHDATFAPDGRLTYAAPGLPTLRITAGTARAAAPLLPGYHGENDWPAFSRNGQRAVFHSDLHPDAPGSIFLWERNGVRALLALPAGQIGAGMDLSPDGRFLAYELQEQGDIVLRDVANGNERLLAPHPAYDGHPDFSPDGRHLFFLSERSGERGIYVLNLTQETPFCLFLTREYYVRQFAVSPDGQTIYFLSDSGGQPSVWAIPFRGPAIENIPGYRYLYMLARQIIAWADYL